MKYTKLNRHTQLYDLSECAAPCKAHCVSSPPKLFKYCCVFIACILVAELLLFNILCICGYVMLKDSVLPFLNLGDDKSLIEQLSERSSMFRKIVHTGKTGSFVSLMQETLERVYITFPENNGKQKVKIGSLGLDVSNSGEAMLIYSKILSRSKFPYSNLVIDIGANDGLIGSNSFNFILWGWDAILVEPQSVQLQLAKHNLWRYYTSFVNKSQTVRFVEAVLGKKDEMVPFLKTSDITSMESHVLGTDEVHPDVKDLGQNVILVQSLSVRTFTAKYKVPKYFGVLSIDAEGQGNVILHQFIDLGYRPAYIVYEDLHEREWEAPIETYKFLALHGYQYLCKRGFNHILEHQIIDD